MKFNSLIVFISVFLLTSFAYKPNSKTDYLITISTDFGEIKVVLFDDTPIHKANFLGNIEAGLYDSSKFHRVINNFMIQGGEPSKQIFSDTTSFEGRTVAAEFRQNRKHHYGALAAARTENPEKRSDKTQFYIVQNKYGAHHLDNAYTVFGKVVGGMNVVDKIANSPLNGSSPTKDIKFKISYLKVKRADMIKFYGTNYQEEE